MSNNVPPCIAAMISQLGGRQIFAMAFTKSVFAVKPLPELTLHIAPALKRQVGATHVIVTLEASDTYTVKLVRVTKGVDFAVTTVKEEGDIYAESLRPMVEQMTGLALSLGSMRSVVRS